MHISSIDFKHAGRVARFGPAAKNKEAIMPFANYKFPQGTLTAEQKEEIIHKTTDMFVGYFGEDVRPFTMVLVDEVVDGGWGRADEVLTIARMRERSQQPKG
jgi:4-oxalocrotonate tautomerase